MTGKSRRDGDNGKIIDPTNVASLSIRDVVLIMAAVVSVVAAWGVYGTRLSLVESSNVTLTRENKELKELVAKEIAEIKADITASKNKNEQEHKEMRSNTNRIDKEQARRKSIVDKVEQQFLNKK